jgi:hypothetical protein
VSGVDAVVGGFVSMMLHIRYVLARCRARRAMRRAVARDNPTWQREDLYERV